MLASNAIILAMKASNLKELRVPKNVLQEMDESEIVLQQMRDPNAGDCVFTIAGEK